MGTTHTYHKVSLVTGYEAIVPELLRRLVVVVLLISLVVGILWLDRGGLRDNAHPGRELSFLDVTYFAVVTITTVGYGDIVPVTPRARLIGALIITPIRVFILIAFIGTAYQLVLERYREAYQMRKVQARLRGHVIICGYGVKGHATAEELLSFGRKARDIVVIDSRDEVVEDAAKDGFVALKGDATAEITLNTAVIERASAVVVDVDRDDTTVLICLTAKHLNPGVCLVAAAREDENVPLIYQSGADAVVASPIAGGHMLALATYMPHVTQFIDDILAFGKGLDFGEYSVQAGEAGLTARELPELSGKLVVGAYHEGAKYTFDLLQDLPLDFGDVVIYFAAKPGDSGESRPTG